MPDRLTVSLEGLSSVELIICDVTSKEEAECRQPHTRLRRVANGQILMFAVILS